MVPFRSPRTAIGSQGPAHCPSSPRTLHSLPHPHPSSGPAPATVCDLHLLSPPTSGQAQLSQSPPPAQKTSSSSTFRKSARTGPAPGALSIPPTGSEAGPAFTPTRNPGCSPVGAPYGVQPGLFLGPGSAQWIPPLTREADRATQPRGMDRGLLSPSTMQTKLSTREAGTGNIRVSRKDVPVIQFATREHPRGSGEKTAAAHLSLVRLHTQAVRPVPAWPGPEPRRCQAPLGPHSPRETDIPRRDADMCHQALV